MKNKVVIGISILVALTLLIGGSLWSRNAPSKYDGFAQCLENNGAKFYGAFWCPHCQNQKAMFGNAEKYLPYIECSTSDGQGQLSVCEDADILSYPTWEFANGERLTGEIPLNTLAEKTGCALP